MTAEVKTVVLNRSNQSVRIEASAAQTAELKLANIEDEGLGDLQILVSGRSHSLEGFCGRRSWDSSQNCFPAEISYILSHGSNRIFLLGLTTVCVVTEAGDVCSVLKLFRSANDDQSFFRPFEIVDHKESTVVRYEGGVFGLTANGTVIWHTKLAYDDVLIEQDGEQLTLCNEHVNEGKPWRLRLADGSTLCT